MIFLDPRYIEGYRVLRGDVMTSVMRLMGVSEEDMGVKWIYRTKVEVN